MNTCHANVFNCVHACVQSAYSSHAQTSLAKPFLVVQEMAASLLKWPATVHGEADTQAGNCSRASQTSSPNRRHGQAVDMNTLTSECVEHIEGAHKQFR